ncbi:MAG TPA: alanine dehydrogenase, partial [Vicinamibacteria bacterium]|nr:alanine dehydrogenase [Vicinamibacteria bacterium]
KPRSVVMDLAIDMGGCFETSRPTAFSDPTYEVDGILHFCVPNLPAVAARASTLALTNAALPYLTAVADEGLERALEQQPDLRRGLYVRDGRCAHPGLARAFGLALDPAPPVLAAE